MARERFVHVEHIWGTVVSVDIALHRTPHASTDDAIAELVQWLRDVDAVFSTFKSDSVISQLRRGDISEGEVDAGVADVIQRCRRMVALTEGAFDPWAVPGGFDPSGLVKGWAADRAATLLMGHGFKDFMINAGGDIATRGFAEPQTPWVIGLQHPNEPGQIYTTVSLTDGAVATSGLYERGEHIHAEHLHPDHEIMATSATVVGSDCATADALATALLITGKNGLRWIERMPSWSAQVVVDQSVTSIGPAFTQNG